MKISDIHRELNLIIGSADILPVAYENFEENISGDYCEVKYLLPTTLDRTLKGDDKRISETLQIDVVTATGLGTTSCDILAERFVDLFPNGHVINFTGYNIEFKGHGQHKSGYPADGKYRTPVMFKYVATAT